MTLDEKTKLIKSLELLLNSSKVDRAIINSETEYEALCYIQACLPEFKEILLGYVP